MSCEKSPRRSRLIAVEILSIAFVAACSATPQDTRDSDGPDDGTGGDSVSAGGDAQPGVGGGAAVGSASGGAPNGATGGAAGARIIGEYDLDCGPAGIVLEAHGPPQNRVNYIIVGDGYSQSELDTRYVEHLEIMLADRFTAEREPYLRYRNFVNICALKVPSVDSGIQECGGANAQNRASCPTTNTAFDGWGNTDTRLGYINDSKVTAAITDLLPSDIEVDWRAVVLNGPDGTSGWWNSGGRIMVWQGAHRDSAGAAMHEGGHSFQILADEYGGGCGTLPDESRMRVNVTRDSVDTAGKWTAWLGFDHTPGTGLQGTYEGGQYCDSGVWRPSVDSVMNSLWRSSYFNPVSLENGVRIIYDLIDSLIDTSTPTSQTTPGVLEVRVIDPGVLKIDWAVDGRVVAEDGGETFDIAAQGLASGSHIVSARVYDDTQWVRGDRAELEESIQWTMNVP